MIPSTQAWFAGGERVGYDPKARAMVATEDAPLRIFMRREGVLARAVSLLPTSYLLVKRTRKTNLDWIKHFHRQANRFGFVSCSFLYETEP